MDHNRISNVFHLHKYEVLVLYFEGLFVYTEARLAYLLPDPFFWDLVLLRKDLITIIIHMYYS